MTRTYVQPRSLTNNKVKRILPELFYILKMMLGPVNVIEPKNLRMQIQSTLVISKSKGPAETLRDIRTSTYQMCRIEENTKRTNKFHK